MLSIFWKELNLYCTSPTEQCRARDPSVSRQASQSQGSIIV